MATIRTQDAEALARKIATVALARWREHDCVRVCGGGAEIVAPALREHFANVEVLRPKVRVGDGMRAIEPVYANAVGFYEVARRLYE